MRARRSRKESRSRWSRTRASSPRTSASPPLPRPRRSRASGLLRPQLPGRASRRAPHRLRIRRRRRRDRPARRRDPEATLERRAPRSSRSRSRVRRRAGSLRALATRGRRRDRHAARLERSREDDYAARDLGAAAAARWRDPFPRRVAAGHPREQGLTVLLVEQNLQKALEVAQRGYVIETGTVKLSGSSPDLLADPAIRSAYLGL